MIKLLRKLLYIQTIKVILVNPDDEYVRVEDINNAFKNFPVIIFLTGQVKDMKIIDTGIPVKRKGGEKVWQLN